MGEIVEALSSPARARTFAKRISEVIGDATDNERVRPNPEGYELSNDVRQETKPRWRRELPVTTRPIINGFDFWRTWAACMNERGNSPPTLRSPEWMSNENLAVAPGIIGKRLVRDASDVREHSFMPWN